MNILNKKRKPKSVFFFGVPETIRTSGQRLRRPLLYPAELQAHVLLLIYYIPN